MSQSVSLGVHPANQEANSQSCPGTDVEQDGPPVQPLLSFSLRVRQSLFHLLDLLCGAGDPLLTVSLSDTETGVKSKEEGVSKPQYENPINLMHRATAVLDHSNIIT